MVLGVQTSVIWSAKVWNHYNYKAANSSNSSDHASHVFLSLQSFTRSVHPSVHPHHSLTHSFIRPFLFLCLFICLLIYSFLGHLDCRSRFKYHYNCPAFWNWKSFPGLTDLVSVGKHLASQFVIKPIRSSHWSNVLQQEDCPRLLASKLWILKADPQRAKPNSEAPLVRKIGNPPSRENLVMTSPYDRPSSVQTLGEGEGRLNVKCDFGVLN